MYEISEVKGSPISTKMKQFVCDSLSDIANLPTNKKMGVSVEGQAFETEMIDVGSTAIVLEDSSVWMLSPSGEWKEL